MRGEVDDAVFLAALCGEGFPRGAAARVAGHALTVVGFHLLEGGNGIALDEFHDVPAILGVEGARNLALLQAADDGDVLGGSWLTGIRRAAARSRRW